MGPAWKRDAGFYILILKVLIQVELADTIIREIIETIKLLGLAQDVRPIILIEILGQVITTDINQVKGTTVVCYKFQNTGSCPHGNRCKFRHIQQYKHNVTNTNSMNVRNDQMYSFLGEIRTLVDSVKTIVESHRNVGLTVAFTGYPPKTQQPYQHVAQRQKVFPGPIGI